MWSLSRYGAMLIPLALQYGLNPGKKKRGKLIFGRSLPVRPKSPSPFKRGEKNKRKLKKGENHELLILGPFSFLSLTFFFRQYSTGISISHPHPSSLFHHHLQHCSIAVPVVILLPLPLSPENNLFPPLGLTRTTVVVRTNEWTKNHRDICVTSESNTHFLQFSMHEVAPPGISFILFNKPLLPPPFFPSPAATLPYLGGGGGGGQGEANSNLSTWSKSGECNDGKGPISLKTLYKYTKTSLHCTVRYRTSLSFLPPFLPSVRSSVQISAIVY